MINWCWNRSVIPKKNEFLHFNAPFFQHNLKYIEKTLHWNKMVHKECFWTNNTTLRHSAPLYDNSRRVHALLSLNCYALCCSVRAGARTVPAGLPFSPVGISVHGSKGNALIAQCIQLSLFFLYLLFARQQYGARAGPHSLAWLPYSRSAQPLAQTSCSSTKSEAARLRPFWPLP